MGRNSLKREEHSYNQLVFTRILLDSDEKNGPMIKFGHFEKATEFWNNLPLDLTDITVLSKRGIKWKIVSNFVASLEKLNFNTKQD